MPSIVSSALPPGFTVKGQKYVYTIKKVVGSGAFGITYLASMRVAGNRGSIPTRVALKEFFIKELDSRGRDGVVAPRVKNGLAEKYADDFRHESAKLSRIKHPGIVDVLEAFDANGTCFYAMEYLPNGTLDDLVKGDGLPEEKALPLIAQIGDAISSMHASRMVHLDLKPKNIMLNDDNVPVVIDFGLSKQFDTNGEPESSSSIGAGTPGYAPSEQLDQSARGRFLPSIDIYALGATLYKMLTGKTPPGASELIGKSTIEDRLGARHVSPATISAVKAAMAPVADDRPATVAEFLALLPLEAEQTDDEETVVEVQGDLSGNQGSDGKGHNGWSFLKKPWLWPAVGGMLVVIAAILFLARPKEIKTEGKQTLAGHEYIDLGLSVKWATCNVGASNPADFGDFFAWGEIYPKYTYDWERYQFLESGTTNADVTFKKYNTETRRGRVDRILTLEEDDDAATANWGAPWRTPTKQECVELVSKCKWTKRATVDGNVVYEVTGPNGNSIFLPAAGFRSEKGPEQVSISGRYWTSSLNEDTPQLAWYMSFGESKENIVDSYYRYFGRTIRPVTD